MKQHRKENMKIKSYNQTAQGIPDRFSKVGPLIQTAAA